jgi:PAS domain S-box-containing protein
VTDVLKWFHRLRVSRKLMLISVVFMVPDSVLLTLFLLNINGDIHFSESERLGNEFQRPLERLLEYLPQHRLLARGVGAGLDATDAGLRSAQGRVDDAVAEAATTDARIGTKLQFTNEGLAERHREHLRLATLTSEWQDLKAHVATLSVEEREARHVHLMADVRMMITHVGDTSNLILDPDLDSYYLMDATLLAMPELQDRLASVMATDAFAPGHAISREEQDQIHVAASLLKQADLDRVLSSVRTSLNEDRNFNGRSESLQRSIPPILDEFSAATEAFIQMTLTLSRADSVSPETANAFHAAGERAQEVSFRLWNALDKELDVLLAARIDSFKTRRARSLILTALAALAACGLVTFITRSISVPLRRQAMELLQSNQTLQISTERYRLLVESTHAVPWEIDGAAGTFAYISPQAMRVFGYQNDVLSKHMSMTDLVYDADRPLVRGHLEELFSMGKGDCDIEHRMLTAENRIIDVRSVAGARRSSDGTVSVRGITVEVTQQKKLERDLRQAQKLESVGQLAAGVAHEINTPVQFVSDSVLFLRGALDDLTTLIGEHQVFHRKVAQGTADADAIQTVERAAADADLGYLMENIPKALDRSLEGLDRIATIVRSMKEFAHPDQKEMTGIDLNRAIQSTLVISRNEYKFVAEVDTDFGELPLVTCHGGEVNQVILNVVVNAAHAIGEVIEGTDRKGRIAIQTRREGAFVAIRIADTGGGIPEAVRERIFDPFFTTKEVGKGTGQGLAIARAAIVERHGGDLTFETEVGVGTTFIIRLPITGRRPAAPDVAA